MEQRQKARHAEALATDASAAAAKSRADTINYLLESTPFNDQTVYVAAPLAASRTESGQATIIRRDMDGQTSVAAVKNTHTPSARRSLPPNQGASRREISRTC